jgi:predicted phage baseplate assembly protein
MPIPNPSFDNKPYPELVEEARKKIAIYLRKWTEGDRTWTDYNASDPGITFLELFASLTENQIFMLDKIPQRNYFKFLKLLGLSPQVQPPSPPTIYLTLAASNAANSLEIPKGTQFQQTGGADKNAIFFDTLETINTVPFQIYQIVTLSRHGLEDVTRYLEFGSSAPYFFYAFSESPIAGNSSLYIGLEKITTVSADVMKGDSVRVSIFLYEDDLPPIGKHGSEVPFIILSNQVQWEYLASSSTGGVVNREWIPLHLDEDTTNALTMNGTVSFKIPFSESDKYLFAEFSEIEGAASDRKESKELFWIRCRLVKNHYEIPPRISKILLNTVKATFGILGEESFVSNGMPSQAFEIQEGETGWPVTEIIQVKTVDSVSGVDTIWKQIDDFDSSAPEDESYVFDILRSKVLFGNDIKAKIPKLFDTIKVKFRAADVVDQGHVPTGTEFSSVLSSPSSMHAINYFPSVSGVRGQTIAVAFAHARKDMKEPYKGVSSLDIEHIAISTPGLRVSRAKAFSSFEEENTVVVIVVPFSFDKMPLPSKGFLDTVCCHLDKHRLLTTQLRVIEPQYVGIDVYAVVSVKSRANPENVNNRVAIALDNFLSPISRKPEQNAWPFGRDVFRSNFIELMEDVEGLECVIELILTGVGNPMNFEKNSLGDVLIKNNSLVYLSRYSFNVVSPYEGCKKKKEEETKDDSDDEEDEADEGG